jgi:hypothetical protein
VIEVNVGATGGVPPPPLLPPPPPPPQADRNSTISAITNERQDLNFMKFPLCELILKILLVFLRTAALAALVFIYSMNFVFL